MKKPKINLEKKIEATIIKLAENQNHRDYHYFIDRFAHLEAKHKKRTGIFYTVQNALMLSCLIYATGCKAIYREITREPTDAEMQVLKQHEEEMRTRHYNWIEEERRR